MNDQVTSEDQGARNAKPLLGDRAHSRRLVAMSVGSALVTAVVMFVIMSHYSAAPPVQTASVAVTPTVQLAEPNSSLTSSVTQNPQETSTPPVAPAPVPPATAATIPLETSVAPTPPPSVEVVTTQDPIEPFLEGGWIIVDATLSARKDLGALHGAPQGFQSYAASFVGILDEEGCTPEIWVYAVHPSGFAYGSDGYSDCGGGAYAIWSDQTGAWEPLFFMQDLLPCEDLMDAGVPENIGELQCYSGGQEWYY